VPAAIRVNQATIRRRSRHFGELHHGRLRSRPARQPPIGSNQDPTSSSRPATPATHRGRSSNPSSGAYDATIAHPRWLRVHRSVSISGANNATVIPSGRGMTFSPPSVTTYPGATERRLCARSPPRPSSSCQPTVTMDEDQTFYGTLTAYDIEQEPGSRCTVTATSDNPQLIGGSGMSSWVAR
jgi:hypothetical protein